MRIYTKARLRRKTVVWYKPRFRRLTIARRGHIRQIPVTELHPVVLGGAR